MNDASTTTTDPILEISGLEVTYRRPGSRESVRAVKGVDLVVPRGRTVGLVGESGSGKSSIGSAVLGLTPVTGGTVMFDGADITHAPRARRRELARQMQVIFQDPYGSMNPARTVGETVTEALRYNVGLNKAAIRGRLEQALEDVGLPTSAGERYPAEFSGGQRQRLAIARALVMEPSFIVCDEPTSALDLSVQAQVLNLLVRLRDARQLSYLFISHDLSVVRYLCDQIVVLQGGEVVESGSAQQITEDPQQPYTKSLLMAAPLPDPDQQRRQRELRHELIAAETS